MKNCGVCEHVRTQLTVNIKTGYCSLNDMVVPQHSETGKPIQYLRVPNNCPLKERKQ